MAASRLVAQRSAAFIGEQSAPPAQSSTVEANLVNSDEELCRPARSWSFPVKLQLGLLMPS